MELELILQTNENLPTDELEIVIRDLVVMDIRERTEHDAQVAAKERERIFDLLEKHAYMMWQSPQSCGQKKVVEWEYIASLRQREQPKSTTLP
jgi:hypothetical protein